MAAMKTQPQTQPSVARQPLVEAAQPEWPTYVAPSASYQSVPAQPSRQRRGGKRQADGRLDVPSPKKLILAISSSPPGVETRYGTAASVQQESTEEASTTDLSKKPTEQEASPSRRLILKVSGARPTARQAAVEPERMRDGSPIPAAEAGGNERAANAEHHILPQTRDNTSIHELPQRGDEDRDQNASKPQAPSPKNVVACETENAPGEIELEQASSQAVPIG